MTDFRKSLLDRMIKLYGFEHPLTIQFASSCESYVTADTAPFWNNILENIVELHEAHPYTGPLNEIE